MQRKTTTLSLFLLLAALFLITACDDDSSSGNNSNNANNTNNTNNVNNVNNFNNVNNTSADWPYPIADTGETACYGESLPMGCVDPATPFGGQDAQYLGYQPRYTDNGDGSVSDQVTRLMWMKSPDTNGDGVIDASDKLTYGQLQSYADTINGLSYAGYSDWRVPTIKELYSLILFSGTDPSSGDESNLIPFIDTDYFDFAYGDASAGERTIDSQYASSNIYVGPTTAEDLLFGVNFADGRIKGYGLTINSQEKTFFLILVRGNAAYGVNDYVDNGDGTVSDRATGLMWAQDDSGEGMTWEDALAYAQQMNAVEHLGYNDWRVPNIKELQSIIDYTRSPESSASPALDPIFNATSFINELGEEDWPFVWSSTTHVGSNGSVASASYVAFGKAMGYMNGNWIDVHGAGAQRSDPKNGDPADYPTGFGPQGDAIRIFNYVRLVRDGATYDDSVLAPQTCGNGECDAEETLELCPQDCGSVAECGNQVCDAGETSETCPADCTAEGPVSCETQADCDAPGGCPEELTEGCTCSDTPDGSKLCVPNCNTAEDCPPGPGGATMTCNPEGICVPQ